MIFTEFTDLISEKYGILRISFVLGPVEDRELCAAFHRFSAVGAEGEDAVGSSY